MNAVARFAGLAQPVRPLLVAVVAALIIAATAFAGIQRGMDHMVTWGPEDEQWFMTVAISDSVYGLNLGYVGYRSVNDKMKEIWNRGAAPNRPDDPVLITNSSDGDLINEALAAAASLGPQPPGYIADGTLITTLDEDMGEVDFYKLAFRLFGLKIQSYYYLFFVLLSVCSLFFIVTFRNNTYALVTLLLTLFAFYVEMHLNLLSPQMPTFPGQRHGSTLALIPMWYFVFSIGRKPTVTGIIGGVVQVAMLILAWRIRGSVSWIFLLLLVLLAGNALRLWLRRPSGSRSWQDLIADAATWPALILVLGVAGNFVYNRVELHPVYFTDDVIAYHGPWHSAYLGLNYEPDLVFPRSKPWLNTGDTLGYIADRDYADQKRLMPWSGADEDQPPGWVSPWTKNIKSGLHEDLLRGALLHTVAEAPLKALHLYAWQKPRAIWSILKFVFLKAPGLSWLWWTLAGGVFGSLFCLVFGTEFDARRAFEVIGVGALALLFSTIPNVWAYPATHTVADLSLLLVIFVELAVALAIFAIGAPARRSSGAKKTGEMPATPVSNA